MQNVRAGADLSALDGAGFQPTQKRVSAQVIEGYRAGITSGKPFLEDADQVNDPIEVSPSGAVKDGHHRLAAMLLEGVDPRSLPPKAFQISSEDQILFPPRLWEDVIVDP